MLKYILTLKVIKSKQIILFSTRLSHKSKIENVSLLSVQNDKQSNASINNHQTVVVAENSSAKASEVTLARIGSKVRFDTASNHNSNPSFSKFQDKKSEISVKSDSQFPVIKTTQEKLKDAMQLTIQKFKANALKRQKSQQSVFINSDSNPFLITQPSTSNLNKVDEMFKGKNKLPSDYKVVKTLENSRCFSEALLKSKSKAERSPLIYNNIIGLSYTKYYTQKK